MCVMVTNFLELATTLKYLGAKWLPGKKVNFMPCLKGSFNQRLKQTRKKKNNNKQKQKTTGKYEAHKKTCKWQNRKRD